MPCVHDCPALRAPIRPRAKIVAALFAMAGLIAAAWSVSHKPDDRQYCRQQRQFPTGDAECLKGICRAVPSDLNELGVFKTTDVSVLAVNLTKRCDRRDVRRSTARSRWPWTQCRHSRLPSTDRSWVGRVVSAEVCSTKLAKEAGLECKAPPRGLPPR
jgi:hypothetical protein